MIVSVLCESVRSSLWFIGRWIEKEVEGLMYSLIHKAFNVWMESLFQGSGLAQVAPKLADEGLRQAFPVNDTVFPSVCPPTARLEVQRADESAALRCPYREFWSEDIVQNPSFQRSVAFERWNFDRI